MPNKSQNLQILKDNNFLVPDFICMNIDDDFDKQIQALDKNIKYAVRSDMGIEDSENQSYAGQFQTYIDVKFSDIIESIQKIIQHAQEHGVNDDDIFIIVQEYIICDYAGIAFSRNPMGGREMNIEYHKGIGEDIVSGKVSPFSIYCYHNEQNISNKFGVLKNEIHSDVIQDFINNIKTIENIFTFPQDIEWGISGGEFYFLQSRNITTLSQEHYKKILCLEKELEKILSINVQKKSNKNGGNQGAFKYFFQKNEVSEIAPRPDPLTYTLLEKIYAKNGPIDTFYKQNNITTFGDYLVGKSEKNKNCGNTPLQVIGNELYIDKEKELKYIFPSVSLLKNNNFSVSFDAFSGLIKSIKNFFFLLIIKNKPQKIKKILQKSLQKKLITEDFNEALSDFLEAYICIYEINFFTGRAFSKLEKVLKNEKLTFSQALNLNFNEQKKSNYSIDTSGFIGNSLNISDSSTFITIKNTHSDSCTQKLWEEYPQWKKNFLTPYIQEAISMQDVREKGRYLTVKHMSHMRNIIISLGKKQNIQNIFFATLDEISTGSLNQDILNRREKIYNSFNHSSFGQTLQHCYIQKKSTSFTGLSSGKITGVLVGVKNINNIQGKKILLVDMLFPELVEYFDDIGGILSTTGGCLSHLAIMAREKGIPVVSGDYSHLHIAVGDIITLDGGEGTIVVKNSGCI